MKKEKPGNNNAVEDVSHSWSSPLGTHPLELIPPCNRVVAITCRRAASAMGSAPLLSSYRHTADNTCRLKLLREGPYDHKAAADAIGYRTDNGPEKTKTQDIEMS